MKLMIWLMMIIWLINDCDNKINNNKTITSKSFEYEKKMIGTTPKINYVLEVEIVVPLKYLSNFWRSIDLPLVNCKIKLNLR